MTLIMRNFGCFVKHFPQFLPQFHICLYNSNMKIHLTVARFLTNLLDRQFSVFGVRFGLDPIIGLIPGIGDLVSFALSLYLIWIAVRLNLPAKKVGAMVQNIVIDLLIGAIPIIGDIGDVVYRANYKNLQILENYVPPTMVEAEIIDDSV